MDKFHALNNELMPLHYAMVAEPNPMPVKAAMEIVEKCSGEVRLPLVTASNSTVERLRKLL
jgi:4-hydroxy-tetrahydrodipicolinate synthase